MDGLARHSLRLAALLCALGAPGGGAAQANRGAGRKPPGPTLPSTWVNGPALTNEQLAGKVVYLVFFEET